MYENTDTKQRGGKALQGRVLLGLFLFGVTLSARSELIWQMRLENPPAVVAPNATVEIRGILFNSPSSDRNLGVLSSGFLGEPPGFDFEIGAIAGSPPGFPRTGFQFGSAGDLQDQFHGVDLAPGEMFHFVFGTCTPPEGRFDPGIYEIRGQLSLFESSTERPVVGSSSDYVRWMVSDAAVMHAAIDIRPSSKKNLINPSSRGKIKVAILSTFAAEGDYSDFDARDVDVTTVRFGPGDATVIGQNAFLEDVDRDGDIDLLLQFSIPDIGVACGDTELTLSGMTYDGILFAGTDAVTPKGCVR